MTEHKKHIIITGGAHGLGKALAKIYCQNGNQVIAIDKDSDALKQLESSSPNIRVYTVDVSSEEEVIQFANQIIQDYKIIDGLINNAGVSHLGKLDDLKTEDFRWVLQTNLMGTVYCTKYILPALQKSNRAFIANIGSGIIFQGLERFSAYATSKAGVKIFTECLRAELSDSNIDLINVYPCPIATDISRRGRYKNKQVEEKEWELLQRTGYAPDDFARKIVKNIQRGKKEIFLGTEIWWHYQIKRLFPGVIGRMIFKYKHKLPF